MDPQGKVEAKYFNPNQIHVSEATAKVEENAIFLNVTLQDTGYPGCRYELKANEEGNQLVGTYFQAAQNQTYDISFQKMEP